ncbi:MAG: hypothetical protein [Circular genetic element sp.]|nr:MAG: hypothetical protein [Circular genetic element sp.]
MAPTGSTAGLPVKGATRRLRRWPTATLDGEPLRPCTSAATGTHEWMPLAHWWDHWASPIGSMNGCTDACECGAPRAHAAGEHAGHRAARAARRSSPHGAPLGTSRIAFPAQVNPYRFHSGRGSLACPVLDISKSFDKCLISGRDGWGAGSRYGARLPWLVRYSIPLQVSWRRHVALARPSPLISSTGCTTGAGFTYVQRFTYVKFAGYTGACRPSLHA